MELNQKQIDLLIRCYEKGYLEYRDTDSLTFDIYISNVNITSTEMLNRYRERYDKRNEGGTFHLVSFLEDKNYIQFDNNAWHTTYLLTPKGENLVKVFLREREIDKVLNNE